MKKTLSQKPAKGGTLNTNNKPASAPELTDKDFLQAKDDAERIAVNACFNSGHLPDYMMRCCSLMRTDPYTALRNIRAYIFKAMSPLIQQLGLTTEKNPSPAKWLVLDTDIIAEVMYYAAKAGGVPFAAYRASDASSDYLLMQYAANEDSHAYGLYVSDRNARFSMYSVLRSGLSEAQVKSIDGALRRKAIIMGDVISPVSNPDIVPMRNCIFDYSTKLCRPYTMADNAVSKLSVDMPYDPITGIPAVQRDVLYDLPGYADEPEHPGKWSYLGWLQHSIANNDPELYLLFQQIPGALARPNVPWGKALLLYNTTGSGGKGTLLRHYVAIVGKQYSVKMSFNDFEARFRLEGIVGKQLVYSDENNTNEHLKFAQEFKATITGSSGDVIKVEGKNRDPYDYSPHVLVIMCMNEYLSAADKSDSFSRRLLTVPFARNFQGSTTGELSLIKNDFVLRPEVLRYAVYHALVELPFYDKFCNPAACQALKQNMILENDPVAEFASEVIPQLEGNKIPMAALWDAFQQFVGETRPNSKATNQSTFTKRFKSELDKAGGWKYADNRSSKNRPSYDPDTEPFIVQYNLQKWRMRDALKTSWYCIRRANAKEEDDDKIRLDLSRSDRDKLNIVWHNMSVGAKKSGNPDFAEHYQMIRDHPDDMEDYVTEDDVWAAIIYMNCDEVGRNIGDLMLKGRIAIALDKFAKTKFGG